MMTDVKNTFFTGDAEHFKENLSRMLDQFSLNTGEIKDLSVAALIAKLLSDDGGKNSGIQTQLVNLLGMASTLNMTGQSVGTLLGSPSNGKAK